jgi:hypothetical protein
MILKWVTRLHPDIWQTELDLRGSQQGSRPWASVKKEVVSTDCIGICTFLRS